MTKEEENSTKCSICDNVYVDGDVKVRDHWHITGKKEALSYISKTYSKANNKYLKSYDTKQESKHIISLDGNDSYGYAISKFLPKGEFKWIDRKTLISINIAAIVWKVVFLKLILNILRNYMSCIMNIL